MYENLELGDFSHAEAGIDGYLTSQGEYVSNVFELPEQLRAKIDKHCGGYMKRFGYG